MLYFRMGLHHADGVQNFFRKGDEQAAEQAEKALAALAGVMALDAHAYLHHAPAEDDDANGCLT